MPSHFPHAIDIGAASSSDKDVVATTLEQRLLSSTSRFTTTRRATPLMHEIHSRVRKLWRFEWTRGQEDKIICS